MKTTNHNSPFTIVCFLKLNQEGFSKVAQEYVPETQPQVWTFIDEHLHEFTGCGYKDLLQSKEVLRLSRQGIVVGEQNTRTTDDWQLALISDSYSADEAIRLMEKHQLFSPYTLILTHTSPKGLIDALNNMTQGECFLGKAQGEHEIPLESLYPYVVLILQAILDHKEQKAGEFFSDLADGIMSQDNILYQIQRDRRDRGADYHPASELERIYDEILHSQNR